MKIRSACIAALAAVTVLITGSAGTGALAQSGFESEPVLNANDLAAPELLKGPHFTVDPKVPVKGFLARFTIRSDYGTFEAHGIHMLGIRVNEVGQDVAAGPERIHGAWLEGVRDLLDRRRAVRERLTGRLAVRGRNEWRSSRRRDYSGTGKDEVDRDAMPKELDI